ncbi:MAG: iron-containing alcohol dehydrogenase [Chloroflexota bacterium]
MESFLLSRLPRITFGAGSVTELPVAVRRHGSRCLLVTGRRTFERLGLGDLDRRLGDAGVQLVGSSGVPTEPGPEVIDDLAATARDLGADVVVGIGGGSVLDTAKAIAGLVRTGSSVMDHLEGVGRGVPYEGPAIPFVAVPTTAGTGSEATRNAVVTVRGAEGYKRSFRDERLIAAEAVIDPDLLAGCGRELIAANGLDALVQLLEAFVSRRANRMTDALALDGLAAVRDGLLVWHGDPAGPTAPDARARMAYAALLSGICLANAGLGAVHGLAAPIGSLLPIAHGAACGALVVATVRTNVARLVEVGDGERLARYAMAGRVLAGLPGAHDVEARLALVELLGSWTATLETPGLGSLGLGSDQVDLVLAGVSTSSLSTNPVALDRDDLAAIVTASL